jgi:hypothetical protein
MLRARRGIRASIPTEEEGPFVSFTDLFVGVLFFFLILIAALMIMQRTSVQMARNETAQNATAHDAKVAALVEAVSQANAQLDALNAKNKELQNKLNSMPNDEALKAAGAAESARRALEKAHAGDVARINALQTEVGGLTTKIDERDRRDKEHPSFRPALSFNVFGSKGPNDTDRRAQVYYWETIRILRSPGDLCIYNPITDFENHTWQKHDDSDALSQNEVGLGKADKCYLTADRVYYMTKEGGNDLKRVSPNLYAGIGTVIHPDGTRETHYVEYRILGIYDDAFKWPHQ